MRAGFGRPVAALVLVASILGLVITASANAPANQYFQRTWERTDKPVADLAVPRTWMWGPEAFTGEMTEDYAEAPNGSRTVQYFDKSRMEITHPEGDSDSIWYVTNGLLATELVTGRVQLGDNTFEQWLPAEVNVAGDPDDPNGPTYRSFRLLLTAGPGIPYDVRAGVTRAGEIYTSETFAAYGVRAEHYTPETFHWVANPFWDFMTSSGTVYEDGGLTTAPLFVNPYYATGFPITEPLWASVKVGGVQRDVLIQVFERRVLTYTPGNPAGFVVEAGNVGRHYYTWRHEQGPPVGTIFYQSYSAAQGTSDIWAMNADGSNVRNLSQDLANDWAPALSPDGRTVAFASDRGKTPFEFDIYLMDVDGGNVRRLTTSNDQELYPTWSPDGRQLAYIRYLNSSDYEIYVMNADGTDQHDLSNRPDAYDASPSWSPDGTRIAFTSIRDGNVAGDVYVVYTNGAGLQRLTDDVTYDSQPNWSKDGTRIVFARDIGPPWIWEIYIMQADGTDQTRMTFINGDDINPAWSPDGSQIAWIHDTDTQGELWVMNSDGAGKARLGDPSVSVDWFSWGLVPAQP